MGPTVGGGGPMAIPSSLLQPRLLSMTSPTRAYLHAGCPHFQLSNPFHVDGHAWRCFRQPHRRTAHNSSIEKQNEAKKEPAIWIAYVHSHTPRCSLRSFLSIAATVLSFLAPVVQTLAQTFGYYSISYMVRARYLQSSLSLHTKVLRSIAQEILQLDRVKFCILFAVSRFTKCING